MSLQSTEEDTQLYGSLSSTGCAGHPSLRGNRTTGVPSIKTNKPGEMALTPTKQLQMTPFDSSDHATTLREPDVSALRDMIEMKVRAKKRPVVVAGSKRKHAESSHSEEEDLTIDAHGLDSKDAQDQKRLKVQDKAVQFLSQRSKYRLAGTQPKGERQPRMIIREKISRVSISKDFKKALEELSNEKPTQEQVKKLANASCLGPNYLGRTASLVPGYRFNTWKRETNGFTTRMILMPAADTHENQALHADISALTQGEITYILGHHLIWTDAPSDEFLSYSKDPLFLVVHALNRFHTGQQDVTIQFLDRRQVKNVAGDQADFYPALELYQAFEIIGWQGWSSPNRISLRPRKFTREYLTHGTLTIEDTRFVQAPIEQLIRDGLFEIFPEFDVPRQHKRCGLYTGQVVFRRVGYPPDPDSRNDGHIYPYDRCLRQVPFTVEFLQKVQKLTRNFMSHEGNTALQEPHLHIFICFLTFQKRQSNDPVFIKWIKQHYTASDVEDLYSNGHGGIRAGYTDVASNLPGVMQYLDLVRDAAAAFGLSELPPNSIETNIDITPEIYTVADAENHRHSSSWVPFHENPQQQRRKAQRESYKNRARRKSRPALPPLRDVGSEVSDDPDEELFPDPSEADDNEVLMLKSADDAESDDLDIQEALASSLRDRNSVPQFEKARI